MDTETINIKVEGGLKHEAQRIATRLGFSLSSILKAYLRHFVTTKEVNFSLPEEPSDYLLEMLRESEEDVKAGRVTSFKNWDEERQYLEKLIKKNGKRASH